VLRRFVKLLAAARLMLFCLALLLSSCKKPYRVGEHVLVEWEDEVYPAYILEVKSGGRFRVHFEGYDSRWDQDVTLDRIKGVVKGPVRRPAPPERVGRAEGLVTPASSSSAAPAAAYKVGDKVKVRWRGTIYPATVVGVVGPDKFLIHYEGHESAWDETVKIDRIVGKR
jgi:hypothetical protein